LLYTFLFDMFNFWLGAQGLYIQRSYFFLLLQLEAILYKLQQFLKFMLSDMLFESVGVFLLECGHSSTY